MKLSAGTIIRKYRTAAGMSLSELARRINYDKGYLSKVENGKKPLKAPLARMIDVALDAGGSIAAMADTTDDTPADREFELGTVEAEKLPVHLCAISGNALLAATEGGTIADNLWALLRHLRDLGRAVSPRLVLDVLTTQTRAIGHLAHAAPAESLAAQQLFHVASRFAEYTGWMFQEADDTQTARQWTAYAIRLATAGELNDVAQFCRLRSADLALSEYRLPEAVNVASHVHLCEHVPPGIRAWAALVQARGHALAGEAGSCYASLDSASELFLHADDQDATPVPLGFTGVANPMKAAYGWALLELGQPDFAADTLQTALTATSPTSLRTRARLTVRTALAHAYDRELFTARDMIVEVLTTVHAVDSATIRADLRQLLKTFNRYQAPFFSDLLHQLKIVISAGTPA